MPVLRRVNALSTLLVVVATSHGCALLGWNCRRGQKTGPVTTVTGRVEPGQVSTHLVPYDQQGTQNDVEISWPGQNSADGPRVRVYVTSALCVEFTPPPNDLVVGGAPSARRLKEPRNAPVVRPGGETDACAVMSGMLSTRTATAELVPHGLIVTGGPKQMKPDLHEYKLHVVGDPRLGTTYSISVTWFRGPDC
jgi:hypothetical protein